jgi:hypothetical protein
VLILVRGDCCSFLVPFCYARSSHARSSLCFRVFLFFVVALLACNSDRRSGELRASLDETFGNFNFSFKSFIFMFK